MMARAALLALFLFELTYIFVGLKPAQGFPNPELAPIIALHLPNAFAAVVAAVAAGWYGIQYLRRRDPLLDSRSTVSAQLATLFALLTTTTGAVFAKVQWGAYWNWDPKQTCVAALLLVYAAYFLLRASFDDPEKRASISAVYVVFASVLTPTLGYVIPTYFVDQSLHPKKASFDSSYKMAIWPTTMGLVSMMFWMQKLAVRSERIRLRLDVVEESRG